MKNKKSIKPKTQVRGKNGILIGCAIFGTAVIMTGAGVGVGYAVWKKEDVKPADVQPIITHKADSVESTMLEKGDMVHYVFTLQKAMPYKVRIVFSIEDDFRGVLMDENGIGILQFCDVNGNKIWDRQLYASGQMWYDINPGQTRTDVYIKQYQDDPDAANYSFRWVTFALSYSYFPDGEYGEEKSIENLDTECDLYLKGAEKESITPDSTTNLQLNLGKLFDSGSSSYVITLTDYLDVINAKFPQLPSVDQNKKANLYNASDMAEVIQKLQKYDNTESLAAMLLTDYVLSVLKAPETDPDQGYNWQQKQYWEKITLSFFDIDLVEGLKDGTNQSKFEFYMYVTGISDVAYKWYNEKSDILYYASDGAFESDTMWSLFDIEWDYEMHKGTMRESVSSNALGLQGINYWDSSTTSLGYFFRSVIKKIYGGVVVSNQWPAWW